ncbi:hypothetical protein M413DRAFT_450150 [Hebeloma cylindrosporum]|uniref:Uncharacterized protein n=1 Tax=Hebeloma cylindrosporum TaxID=76867 RepID=A0A0C2Y0K3_HEBCY|nr:hypothetical protein M413DRAFT_450150 [Hebeloma cylindrosporum h7]
MLDIESVYGDREFTSLQDMATSRYLTMMSPLEARGAMQRRTIGAVDHEVEGGRPREEEEDDLPVGTGDGFQTRM